MKITGRSSSITNSFVNSIIPVIKPSDSDIKESLNILGMSLNSIECSYCGSKYTEWDHLRPLVINKMPTGYISEIQNLVPSCGKCNQSKGNKDWLAWINSDANLSPKNRKIKDLNSRIEKLKLYSSWKEPTKINFPEIVGSTLWNQHWSNCNQIQELLIIAQETSEKIKSTINFARNGLSNNSQNHTNITDKESRRAIKIGKLVQSYIPIILRYSIDIDPKEIERLKDKIYSKNVFNIDFPFLEEVKFDSPKIPRYWKKIYGIDNKYYVVTSEWYDRNLESFKLYIKNKNLKNT